jgi:hypothetical protein
VEDIELTITILPSGNSIVEVDGLKGASCQEVTRKVVERLGKVTRMDHKSEFFESAQQQQQQVRSS